MARRVATISILAEIRPSKTGFPNVNPVTENAIVGPRRPGGLGGRVLKFEEGYVRGAR
jgi:hypothetical protein